MSWLFAVPLNFSGLFLHAAVTAKEGDGLMNHAVYAGGHTMATVGALVVLV